MQVESEDYMNCYDLDNINFSMNLNDWKESIKQTSSKELVMLYKSLADIVSVCHACSNLPEIVYALSSMQYAYGLEITNRFLFGNDEELRGLDIVDDILPAYMSRSDF